MIGVTLLFVYGLPPTLKGIKGLVNPYRMLAIPIGETGPPSDEAAEKLRRTRRKYHIMSWVAYVLIMAGFVLQGIGQYSSS